MPDLRMRFMGLAPDERGPHRPPELVFVPDGETRAPRRGASGFWIGMVVFMLAGFVLRAVLYAVM